MVDKVLHEALSSIENRTPEEKAQMDEDFEKSQEKNRLAQVISDARDHLLRREEDYASEKIANYLVSEYTIESIKNDKATEILYYGEGIRKPNGETFLKEKIRRILLHAFTPQRCNKIIAKVQADTGTEMEFLYNLERGNKEEICTPNGILNIKNRTLSDFTPQKVFFNKINAEYDPKADCPNIKKFLKEILKNEEDVDVVFEILGSCLHRDYWLQIIVMLLGLGENGKGLLLNLFRVFLSSRNVTSIPLNQLTPESFEVADLFGSLANIAGDISNTDLRETGRIKELSSGTDQITAKRKFMPALNFVNYSKLIFSCNELPRVYDFSHGFWRRWLLLEFPYVFLKDKEYELRKDEENVKKADPMLINKLTTKEELSGLLNEALNGLDRLLEKRQFSNTKSTEEVKNLWIRKSDSFTAFCFDNLEGDLDSYVTKKELAQEFNKYCKTHRLKGASAQSIGRTLQEMFGCIEDRKTVNMIQERVWDGIKFNNKTKKTQNTPYSENKNSVLGENTQSFSSKNNSKEQNSKLTDKKILENTDWTEEELKEFHKDGIL